MGTQQMHTTYGEVGQQSRLEATLVRTDEHTLSLHYRFRNEDSRSVFLFNRLYHVIDEKGVYRTDVNLVNVEMDKEQIVISKKIVAVPIEIDVEKTVTPCVTQVRPRESFEETIMIALPLKPRNPYLSRRDSEPKPTTSNQFVEIWFESGFFFASHGTDRLAVSVPTPTGPALYFDPFPISSQQVLRVGPFRIELPVHNTKP